MFAPRYLYIHKKDTADALLMRHASITHSIDLPNGLVLTSAEFHFEDSKDRFEQFDQVQPDAHDGDTVTEQHARVLAHLGVKTGHTAKQVRTLAKKIHNLM
jgi:hypothetical protein